MQGSPGLVSRERIPGCAALCYRTQRRPSQAGRGRPTGFAAGNGLALADPGEPVCQDCGRAHAPSLAALVNLADAAERIGRIGRHSVFPPLTALLDLASAAEKYTSAAQPGEGS